MPAQWNNFGLTLLHIMNNGLSLVNQAFLIELSISELAGFTCLLYVLLHAALRLAQNKIERNRA
jgi:hypothetical protein